MKDFILEDLEDFLNNPHGCQSSLHPNGYIEVPLKSNRELHIWSSCIPKSGYVHNHDWVFVHTVIYGTMWQCTYDQKYYVEKTHDVFDFKTLKPINHQLTLQQGKVKKFQQNDFFIYYAGNFHVMWNDGPTCSIITKVNTRKAQFDPKIVTRIGSKPIRTRIIGLHSSAVPLLIENACERIKETIWKQIQT